LDKQKFQQIVEPIIERRAKGYKKPWSKLNENERQDASIVIDLKQSQTCGDCLKPVVNRKTTIFFIRTNIGRKIRRELLRKWIKKCENCGFQQVISNPFEESAK